MGYGLRGGVHVFAERRARRVLSGLPGLCVCVCVCVCACVCVCVCVRATSGLHQYVYDARVREVDF